MDHSFQALGSPSLSRVGSSSANDASFLWSARVTLSPHPHSKAVRCSERQSSTSPRSIRRSPHFPHSSTRRPEQSTYLSDPKVCPLSLVRHEPFVLSRRRRGENAAGTLSLRQSGRSRSRGEEILDGPRSPSGTLPAMLSSPSRQLNKLQHVLTTTRYTAFTLEGKLRVRPQGVALSPGYVATRKASEDLAGC